MSDQSTPPRLGVSQAIRAIAEAGSVLAIGSYCIGFLIINSYLLTFGYSGIPLFKSSYISAGALFLALAVPLALVAYSTITSHRTFRKAIDEVKANAQGVSLELTAKMDALVKKAEISVTRRKISHLALLTFIPYVILRFIALDELKISDEEFHSQYGGWMPYIVGLAFAVSILMTALENVKQDWKLAIWVKMYSGLSFTLMLVVLLFMSFKLKVLLCIGLMVLAMFWLINTVLPEQPFLNRLQKQSDLVAIELIISLGLVLTAIVFFGTTLYGHLKPEFGGGHPSRVRVFVSEKAKETLTLQGGHRDLSTLLADAQLIDSTENQLLLLLKSSHDDKGLLVQLDRSIVDAVVYLPALP
jgi:hypothetical protein